MADGLPRGQQLSNAAGGREGPPPGLPERAGAAWSRTLVALGIGLALAAAALAAAGRWLAVAGRGATRVTGDALAAVGAAVIGAASAVRRRLTVPRRRRERVLPTPALAAGGAPTAELPSPALAMVAAAARPRASREIVPVKASPPQPRGRGELLLASARRMALTALYHTGVATLRVLGIVGLVVLLAAMAAGLTLPAVLPGARLVKANLDHFSSFPPLPDEFATPAVRSTILASDGSVLSWLYDGEIRKLVKLKDVPMLVRHAVLAIEDARFYEHNGVDYRGIARAARANFESGEISQGGSTLTQQYIKLITNQKQTTLDRKVQEAQYALELERRLTKDQIFENYLNIAYFGDGVYGIATAAEHFFSKSLKDLTLPEAASLAGTIARPDAYNPVRGKENVRRRNAVLDRMVEVSYIPPDQAAEAKKSKLKLKLSKVPNRFGYYHSYISGQLQNDPRFDDALGPVGSKQRKWMVFSGGLTIKTTLVPKHQRYGQAAVTSQLKGALEKPKQRLQGALASLQPDTGAVLAIIGGRKYDPNQKRGTGSINFAVTGRGSEGQSPGSAFKMFFMVAALERGYSPLTTYSAPSQLHLVRKECPAEAGGWDVGNAEGGASGPINMYTATANSVNTWYAQLSQAVGPAAGVEMARRLGITTIPKRGAPRKEGQAHYSDWNVCSAVLGPRNVSPLDMAAAYGVLANDGVRCEPFTVSEIRGPDGKLLYKHKPKCERVLSQRIARTAVDILQGGPAHGTGTAARFGRPLAGKTGTATDYTSAYFAGFTPQISTAVWVGYPKPFLANRPNSMLHEYHGRKVFGGTFPALIFREYMAAAHRGLPERGFARPPAPVGMPVPDVMGTPIFQAVQVLRGLGFAVRVEPRDASPGSVVTQMSPGPGSRVGKGSVILLQAGSREEQPQPGDGDGQGRDGDRGRGGGGGRP